MTVARKRFAELPESERQLLEAWLAEFAQSWHEGRLAVQVGQLPPPGHPLRGPALAEMIQIDQERHWQQGRHVLLESYLQAYPELGTPATVAVDLVIAEYELRRRLGAPADLEDFCRRFPAQAGQLRGPLGHPGTDTLEPGQSLPAAGAPPAAPATLPEQFGRYRILKKLGAGGMGTVYLAQDTKLDRQVALKVPRFTPEHGSAALQRFAREARVAATLEHPNICPVYDVDRIDGIDFLSMAYIAGKPLSEFIDPEKLLPQRQAAALVRKLALALHEAHARGIVHRDLKPSNVMINQRKEPVIMDFGLAWIMQGGDARLTRSGAILGTPAYMAPEQVNGEAQALGPHCDVYSLGVILYELLTGRVPFQGPVLVVLGQVLTQEPLPPSALRADVEPALEAVCRKAMAKKPEDRFASMAELAAALNDCLRADKSGVPPPLPRAVPQTKVIPQPPWPTRQITAPADAASQPPPKKRGSARQRSGRAGGRRARRTLWWLAPAVLAAVGLVVGGAVYVAKHLRDTRAARVQSAPTGGPTMSAAPPPPRVADAGADAELAQARTEAEAAQVAADLARDEARQAEAARRAAAVWADAERKAAQARQAFDSGDMPGARQGWQAARLAYEKAQEASRAEVKNSIGMVMLRIPAGKFRMGAPEGEDSAGTDEKPQREVEISKAFYLGKYEVTQEQYRKVMNANPSFFSANGGGKGQVAGMDTANFPVENVSWEDAVEFCRRLSALPEETQAGRRYELPTEAEWEYACRGGTDTPFYFGPRLNGQQANCDGNSPYGTNEKGPYLGRTAAVGSYAATAPHPWGLCDMHGNVWEWCQDWYDNNYYRSKDYKDPQGLNKGDGRVLRGGSWDYIAWRCRAHRYWNAPAYRDRSVGFRVRLRLD